MNVVRGARKQRFVVVDRATINDANLSFRARGLLAWMLDKPDGWRATAEAISDATTEGRDAIRTALRELEAAGYLTRRKFRAPSGRWEAEMVVFETPQTEASEPSPERETSAGEHLSPQPDSSAGEPSADFQASKEEKTRREDSLLAPASAAPPQERARDRDPLFDAFAASVGHKPVTSRERGAWKSALAELRRAGATAEQVTSAVIEHRRRWPGASVTLPSLVKHWGMLTATGQPPDPPTPAPAAGNDPDCPRCSGLGWICDDNGDALERCSCVAPPPPIAEWAPEPIGATS